MAAAAWAESPPIAQDALAAGIAARRNRVAEFRQIARLAAKRGLRAFLFGGTAATFAHYVKADLLRQAGDAGYRNARGDYRLSRMFRGSQDLDIVITRADGTAESPDEIARFGAEVQAKVRPHAGNAYSWEIRGLKTAYRTKDTLLDNYDFQNQSTDSQSTGLIELTASRDPVASDLRGGTFLADAAAGTVRYLRSPSHGSTARTARGENPEILSAVRCLAKAFQFGLEPDEESKAALREVIAAFDPKVPLPGYVQSRLEQEARKLYGQSRDLERSSRVLDELGLKAKLVAVGGPPENEGSLAWLLTRKPLARAAPDRPKEAVTAGALGIKRVAHGTPAFDNLLSLTSSPDGIPNAFASRRGVVGEAASLGEGYYTVLGETGFPRGGGEGFHIVHDVDPLAVLDVDFVLHSPPGSVSVVVWKNASALRVAMPASDPPLPSFLSRLSKLPRKACRSLLAKIVPPGRTIDPLGVLFASGAVGGLGWLLYKWEMDVWNDIHRDDFPYHCRHTAGGVWTEQGCFCANLQTVVRPLRENCNSSVTAMRVYDDLLREMREQLETGRSIEWGVTRGEKEPWPVRGELEAMWAKYEAGRRQIAQLQGNGVSTDEAGAQLIRELVKDLRENLEIRFPAMRKGDGRALIPR